MESKIDCLICSIDGCGSTKNIRKAKGAPMCVRHYAQFYRTGILKRTKFDKNEIVDCRDYYEMLFYNKKSEVRKERMKFDKKNLDFIKRILNRYKFYLTNQGGSRNLKTHYAAYRVNGKMFFLHRVILEKILGRKLKSNELVDHENGEPLDNREFNLRVASPAQNNFNSKRRVGKHGFRGVQEDSRAKGLFVARIRANNKTYTLGYSRDKKEAYKLYLEGAKKYHGEYAADFIKKDYEKYIGIKY